MRSRLGALSARMRRSATGTGNVTAGGRRIGKLHWCNANRVAGRRQPAAARTGMADGLELVTNVLPVEFRPAAFHVWRRPFGDLEELAPLREASAPHLSVQLEGGFAHFVAVDAESLAPAGTEPIELTVADNLRMVARLTTEALLRRFATYEPIRRKPFVFLGRKRQLMHDAADILRVTDPLLNHFRIWPKYTLDARVIEVHADEPFVGITVEVATRWEIVADLGALQRAGIDLGGLYVVRRNRQPDERPLVGRVERVVADQVELSESTTDRTSVAIGDVMLEGRRDAFARCLEPLLGANYRRYDELPRPPHRRAARGTTSPEGSSPGRRGPR